MAVFLNLQHLQNGIKEKILKEIEIEFFPADNDKTNYFRIMYHDDASRNHNEGNSEMEIDNIKGIELDEKSNRLNEIKLKLKEILIRLGITDYVVTIDSDTFESLIFLERSILETKGVLLCRHCGMEFEDEIQLGNHLRIHFII